MRIVTRPDFDGIVCAVLISRAEEIQGPFTWLEPGDVQNGEAEIKNGDIMANLPYDERCTLWFDHHVSNRPESPVAGAFKIAPSAAGVVYEYYREQGKLDNGYDSLVYWADIIDAAKLTRDQVIYPENHPYVILSMTVRNRDESDPPYWEKLVDLLKNRSIEEVMADEAVKTRKEAIIRENRDYEAILRENSVIYDGICVTDFRHYDEPPSGNRFLAYSLFPETIATIKIRYADPQKEKVLVSIGHSIFNDDCRV
ncbi:MAG: hypothetical protein K9J83_04945, partial [Desulfarculaceae bacterium]|nr:hypothetical protein [Desulfarculaceae bacterium]